MISTDCNLCVFIILSPALQAFWRNIKERIIAWSLSIFLIRSLTNSVLSSSSSSECEHHHHQNVCYHQHHYFQSVSHHHFHQQSVCYHAAEGSAKWVTAQPPLYPNSQRHFCFCVFVYFAFVHLCIWNVKWVKSQPPLSQLSKTFLLCKQIRIAYLDRQVFRRK